MASAADASPVTGYAAIMVPMDSSADALNRARIGASLAGRFGSHLLGVAAQEARVPVFADGSISVQADMIIAEQRLAHQELLAAEGTFRTAIGNRADIEWRSKLEDPNRFAARHARAVDLILVGRATRESAEARRMAVDPGDLLMNAGRPVLVVPPGLDYFTARRVVVAWKDTREARRAVRDSLPFLVQAAEVIVVSVGVESLDAGTTDVVNHLRRHGVQARAFLRTDPSGTVFDEIMETVNANAVDLVVCGAYGHSRMREWVFGGVTRDLLRDTTVSCLMSH